MTSSTPYDFLDDLRAEADPLDLADLQFGDADRADQPQFDILYQLRRVLDPTGTVGTQEANIRDGRGVAVYGRQSTIGPRVDLHYPTARGSRVNLEVDLDAASQRRHRREHQRAMQRAYDQWIAGGRRGPNPLESVASVFVSARAPQSGLGTGAVTQVRRVQYRAGQAGRVSPVTTGRVTPPMGLAPGAAAVNRIFTTLASLPPVRRRGRPQRFEAFDGMLDDAFVR